MCILKKQWGSDMKIETAWGVLISQTGSEVIALGKVRGILPSLVVTNNLTKVARENLEILESYGVAVKEIPFRPSTSDYLLPELLEKRLITLHGYLRVLPTEFLTAYRGRIFNGHPALISKYPELKGLNMQEAIVGKQEEYPFIGSVVHEVTPELDSGRIIMEVKVPNTVENIDQAYRVLRETSLECWEYFFYDVWTFEQ